MKKYTDSKNSKTNHVLSKLLLQRQAPLSEEGLQLALADLTMYLSGNVLFYGAAFIKKESREKTEIHPEDIQKVDLLLANDDEVYYPIFTDTEKLKKWKPVLKKDEYIYVFDKGDLLSFLEYNPKVAACVLNPNEDDLLLHRLLIRNMIAVYSQK